MAKRINRYSRKEIRELAEMYLNTADSISVCSKKLGMAPSTAKALLDRAVIESVITSDEIDDMESKKKRNCREYGGEGAAIRIEQYYATLRSKKRTFDMPASDKTWYTRMYAFSGYTLEHMAQLYFMPKTMLEKAIEDAIKDNLIDEKTVNEIINKLVDDETGGKLLAEYESLMDLRAQNQQLAAMQRKYDKACKKSCKRATTSAGEQVSFWDT